MAIYMPACFGIVDLIFIEQRFVDEIEAPSVSTICAVKLMAAHDADQWVEVVKQRLLILASAVKKIALGV